MTTTFSGKIVLVAGGTGGLGKAVSERFLSRGATVIATYRVRQEFDELAAVEAGHGVRLLGWQLDVTDEAAAHELIEGIFTQHGQLDALVNAVGGYAGGAALWDQPPGVLDRMLALNLRAGYALARAALPRMVQQGRGSFLNVAARAGLEHPAGAAAYGASKAAALALMDAVAAEVTGTGVRVNSVLPSTIDTPANRKAMPDADFTGWTKPDDIARVITFLCSQDAVCIHGASIPVYGS